ncbi:response regulator [Planktothrix sp. FACHB-1355]|nr:response regulator [Planktothrix sp. FACHB-1355]
MRATATDEVRYAMNNCGKLVEISPIFQDGAVSMATKRILVIDDEPDVRAIVQGCLEDIAGWDVITAGSGQEGLVKVVTDKPDAIVLDVMMPGMDGLAFLKELRNQPEGQSIPTVLLTAKVRLDEPEILSKLGIEGVVSKPFDPFMLTEQIAAYLGWDIEE